MVVRPVAECDAALLQFLSSSAVGAHPDGVRRRDRVVAEDLRERIQQTRACEQCVRWHAAVYTVEQKLRAGMTALRRVGKTALRFFSVAVFEAELSECVLRIGVSLFGGAFETETGALSLACE